MTQDFAHKTEYTASQLKNHRLGNEEPTVTQVKTIGYAAKNQRLRKWKP